MVDEFGHQDTLGMAKFLKFLMLPENRLVL